MHENLKSLSLRTLLMFLVGVLVIVALSFAVKDLQQSWAMYGKAVQLAERNHVADHTLQAVKNFAFERGRSNVVLNDHSPVSSINRRFIDERRSLADAHLAEVMSLLPDVAAAEGDELRQQWERIKALRQTLDKQFSLRRAERDPKLQEQWLQAANALMASLDHMLSAVSLASGDIDASFERMSQLRILVLQFRDLAGSESSLLGTELSLGRVPTPEMLASLRILRGRSMQLWAQIEPAVVSLSDRSSLQAMDNVRSELFASLRPLQDQMVTEAARNNRAPITLNSYLASSVSALDSAVELAESINRSAAAYTQMRLERAKWQALVSSASILAILVLAGLVLMLLVRRFTRPLNGILRRIDTLIDRQTASSHVSSSLLRGDDFEKVNQALTLLDDTLEARLRSDEALRTSEQINAAILASLPNAVIATDLERRITAFSPAAERMLGYSAAEVVGQQTPLLFHDPEELRIRAAELSAHLGCPVAPDLDVFRKDPQIVAGQREASEWTYVRKDGVRIQVLLSFSDLHDAQGKVSGRLGVATDISQLKHIEQELRHKAREYSKQNNLLTAVLETIPVGVFMVEAPSGKPLLANDAACLLLGRGIVPDLHVNNLSEAYAAFKLPERIPYPVDEMPLIKGMQGMMSHVDDMLVVGPDGIERILEVMGVPVRDDEGRVWASVASFIDVTGRAKSAAEMTLLAHYDTLTRLPNRRLFDDRMQMAINQARRDKSRLALLMIDLDRFKPVNDNLGHAVGDLLLKAVAVRMQMCLRESDTLARVGGDEFLVILPGIVTEHDAVLVAEKIRHALCEPFDLEGGYRVSIACCIGIALYPDHGQDEKRLARSADEAMYKAKELGRNLVQVFNAPAEKSGEEGHGTGERPLLHLSWHKSYKCGASSIDEEHRELFDLANKLISASINSHANHQQVSQALEELIASVVKHFANEEAILRTYQYEGLADHALKHQSLLRRAQDLRQLAAGGELNLGDLVVFLAQEVVAGHMLHEDKKYFAFLKDAMKIVRSDAQVVKSAG